MGKEEGLAYLSIGNSDDKLPQARWHEFIADVRVCLSLVSADLHGEWFAAPDSPYQNACWCVVVAHTRRLELQQSLARLAYRYGQESIAYADVMFTTFIGPSSGPSGAGESEVLPVNDSDLNADRAGVATTLELHPNCTPGDVAPGQRPDQG